MRHAARDKQLLTAGRGCGGLREEEEEGEGGAADDAEDRRPAKKPKRSKIGSAEQYPVGGLRAPVEEVEVEEQAEVGWGGGRRVYDERTDTQEQEAAVHPRLSLQGGSTGLAGAWSHTQLLGLW